MSLTGRTRYREHKRAMRPSLLVLQVEYKGLHMDSVGGMDDYTAWRDAEVQDITTLEGDSHERSL